MVVFYWVEFMKTGKLYLSIKRKWLIYVWFFAHEAKFKRLSDWLFHRCFKLEVRELKGEEV